jgi:hypothetical protein
MVRMIPMSMLVNAPVDHHIPITKHIICELMLKNRVPVNTIVSSSVDVSSIVMDATSNAPELLTNAHTSSGDTSGRPLSVYCDILMVSTRK